MEAFIRVLAAAPSGSLPGAAERSLHAELHQYLQPALDRFEALSTDEEREGFRKALGEYCRAYALIAQIVDWGDPDLERLYQYGRLLLIRLPGRPSVGVDVGDADLTHFRLEFTGKHNVSLGGADGAGLGDGVVRGHAADGGGFREPELRPLSEVIQELNERFGVDLGSSDEILVYQQVLGLVQDAKMQQVALTNDEERFAQVADDRLDDIVAENADRNTEFMKLYFDNAEFQKAIKEAARKRAYRIINAPARDEALARLRAEMARETGLRDLSLPLVTDTTASPRLGEPGNRLLAGRYRIDGSLGRGGMGEVFHGYDERLDRQVAIKVLRPPGGAPLSGIPDSPEAAEILDAHDRDRRRFLREIRVTAQLEQPGIPAVYDTGESDLPGGGKELWLVMQLLRGSTLSALLDQADYLSPSSSPTVAWACGIATQIAAVLVGVHREDIVHRDIKPSNVMIVDGGLVKVLDFGISLLRGASSLPRLTQVGRTVGTPIYMSPEQYLGKLVSSASDIYSLGCLLFELLTGDPPFLGVGDGLRARHLQEPPPSARSARSDVPAAVDALIVSMLAKDPVDRPSADAVYVALLPVVMGAIEATPSWVATSRDPTRPYRVPLLPAAPVLPGATVTSAAKLTVAEKELLKANVQALLENDQPSQAVRLLESAVARAGDPVTEVELREDLAVALLMAGEYGRAAPLFEAVGADYRRFGLPPTDALVLNCSYQAGQAFAELGRPEEALRHLRFYVANAAAGSPDPEEALKILESRFVIAQMLATLGDTEEALAELRAIRPMFAAMLGEDSTMVRNLDKQIARLTP
jgi:serine/threonine protein kinase